MKGAGNLREEVESSPYMGIAEMVEITSCNIFFTGCAAIMRLISIVVNWYLVFEYWKSESYAYSAWTLASILIPMLITSIIYSHIVSTDRTGRGRILYRGTMSDIVISYLFRDGYTLNYALNYSQAKKQDNKEGEIRYYQKYVKEECNVGFIRLFDSFLETAPQKILQLVIVLRFIKTLTYFRAFTFVIYFLSIAWCLVAYNRSNRLVQLDKYDIGTNGLIVQFFFLLCLTVSRTLCIAYVASIYPLATLAMCLCHIFVCGSIVFLVDAPKLANSVFLNYLCCITFGVVYLFIFTPVKDAPTKYKYIYYLSFCLVQNITACILFIPLYISIAILGLYVIGIVLMIFYYLMCHPGITSTLY
ncbi:XK-related protein 6 [Drosophila tropicalis]|uniref:XK-related protein 6 n=1 Tax=Drosophila tropicalis TaxID=46794 RepID=UPI0035AC1D64